MGEFICSYQPRHATVFKGRYRVSVYYPTTATSDCGSFYHSGERVGLLLVIAGRETSLVRYYFDRRWEILDRPCSFLYYLRFLKWWVVDEALE